MFEIGLISVQANRSLSISYGWARDSKGRNGVVSYPILLLNQGTGSGNIMQVHLLAKKRHNIEVKEFFTTKEYEGSFIDKARSCLLSIKDNYDTYAPDVISEDYWDGTAYLNPLDAY